ncbi:MAG: (Fe-S)-binding protein [Syntrophobacteraceae bacterium]
MADMKHLAGLMKELEDQLVVCMRCGMCQAVCPVYAETGREADVARGKLALLDGLTREIFKDADGVHERVTRCLLCGSCAANCPSGVKVLDIFLKARAILTAYRGLSPIKKAIFRGMLARPGLFDRLLEMGAKMQGLFVKPVDELIGTSCARFTSPLADRHFKALAPTPFHRMAPGLQKRAGGQGPRVLFFQGCLVDKVYPEVGEAVVRAMDHHGIETAILQDLGCCGIPALSSGDTSSFESLVRHNLGRFAEERFDYLLTACATCTSTIRKIWPLMDGDYSDRERNQIKALSEKTLDVAQFLVDKIGVQPGAASDGKEAIPVTYHDPCHLRKSLGIFAQPRKLLQANPAYRLMEMPEADKCCGCGGSFNLQHYDLSASIGRRKRENIVRSGCEVVATGCPACMLQISDMLSQAGDRIRVRHVIEVYADSISQDYKCSSPSSPSASPTKSSTS